MLRQYLVSSMLAAATALGATITIPSMVVLGTDTFSGPTITLPSTVLPTDTLTLTARGEVFLQVSTNGDANADEEFLQAVATYGSNAAGVLTTAPASTGALNGDAGYMALLLGNSSLGFFQVFPANAANGLGSETPPSLLATSVLLSSLGFSSPLPAGTVLQFRLPYTDGGNPSGSFTISGSIDKSTVPEPRTIAMMLFAALVLATFNLCRRA